MNPKFLKNFPYYLDKFNDIKINDLKKYLRIHYDTQFNNWYRYIYICFFFLIDNYNNFKKIIYYDFGELLSRNWSLQKKKQGNVIQ